MLLLMFVIMYLWAILGVRFVGAKENRTACSYKKTPSPLALALDEIACILSLHLVKIDGKVAPDGSNQLQLFDEAERFYRNCSFI